VIGLWLDDASEPVLLLAAMSAFGLLAPLPAVAAAVTYAELRDRKEGRPAAELAKVFE
jgi:hypothetical protein